MDRFLIECGNYPVIENGFAHYIAGLIGSGSTGPTGPAGANFQNFTVASAGTYVTNIPMYYKVTFPWSNITADGNYTSVPNPPAFESFVYDEFLDSGGLTSLTISNMTTSGSITISNCASLTTLSFPNLTYSLSQTISGNYSLTTLSEPVLQYCGGDLSINNGNLATINLNALKTVVGNFSVTSPSLITINAVFLVNLGGFNIFNVSPTGLSAPLTTINMPALKRCNGSQGLLFNAYQYPNLSNITFSALTDASNVAYTCAHPNNPLVTFSFPLLTIIYNTLQFTANSTTFSTFNFPSLATVGNINLSGTQSSWSTINLSNVTRVKNFVSALQGSAYNQTAITGTVSITNIGPTTVNMGGVTQIDYSLSIGSTSFISILLGSLISIGTLSYTSTPGGLTLSTSNALTTLTLTNLTTISGPCVLNSCASLISYSFPALTTIGPGVTPAVAGLTWTGGSSTTTLSMPSLTSVGGDISINRTNSLTTLSMASLATVTGSINFNVGNSLTTLTLTALATVGGTVTIQNGGISASLSTINLAGLVNVGGNITCNTGLGNVTNVSFATGGSLLNVSGNVNFSGQKIVQADIDNILVRLAALDGTAGTTTYGAGRTITLSGGTNATPSATGLTAKATLVGRGVTVFNN